MGRMHQKRELIRTFQRLLDEAGVTGTFIDTRGGHTKLRVTVGGNKHQIVFGATNDMRGQRNAESFLRAVLAGRVPS